MKRFKFFIFLFLFTFTVTPIVHAQSRDSGGFNLYLAAGPNFIFPYSTRIGWNRWEFGLLARGFLGASKSFVSSQNSIYSSFGFGIQTDSLKSMPGFQGAIGWNFDFWRGLGFRIEMLANASFDGSAIAHGLLGVSYGF